MKENVPLSWTYKKTNSPTFNWINLPLSGVPWVYGADIPKCTCVEEVYLNLSQVFPNGFLLRGCSSKFAEYFISKGSQAIRSGAEAVVDLHNLDQVSDSVCELAGRGSRWGNVKELARNQQNIRRVSEFIKKTPYGSKPRLIYLFINSFDSKTRCFVMSSKDDEWLGLLTIANSSENSCHTEMILRNKTAPVGVMEALLLSVMCIYKHEGYKYFSLGEVPFVSPDFTESAHIQMGIKSSAQEFMIFKMGHLLRYAFNYKGLYDFKNKFNPTWRPVYICAAPTLGFRALADLFCETGYLELSYNELLSTIRSYCGFKQPF